MNGDSDMNGLIDRIVNRHMARLLFELEEANCPAVYRNAVKGKLGWMRSDLHEAIDGLTANERNNDDRRDRET